MSGTDKNSRAFALDIAWLDWVFTWHQAFPTLLLFGNNTMNTTFDMHQYCHPEEYDAPSGFNDTIMIHCGILAFYSLFDPYDNGDSSSRKKDGISQLILDRSNVVKSHDASDNNLGYGEITPSSILTCISLIQTIHWNHNQSEFQGKKIVDLGSGNGKVLFAACCLGGFAFEHAVGVEIVKDLHDEAMEYLKMWDAEMDWIYSSTRDGVEDDEELNSIGSQGKMLYPPLKNERKSFVEEVYTPLKRCTRFTFLHQDFTEISSNNNSNAINLFSDSSVIVVHCTLFDSELMSYVQKICEASQQGTYFVMVTKPLNHFSKDGYENKKKDIPIFETLCKRELNMDWGKTTVYIQRKC